jgi:hypothetical protein
MTAALEGGEWSTACPGHTLAMGKTWYPLYRRLGGPQGWSGQPENFAPPGFDPQTVQLVVSRYSDLSYLAHHLLVYVGDYCRVYVIVVSEILDVVHCPSLNIHTISQAGFISCLQMEQIIGRDYSCGPFGISSSC